jgi:hypothetical protein
MICTWLLLLAACSVESFDVEVTIGPGQFPELSWEGDDVGTVTVSQLDSWGDPDFPVWRIVAKDERGAAANPVSSPYRLGDIPDDAHELADHLVPDLIDGSSYVVELVRFNGSGKRETAVGAGSFDW